jgi:hypothetical protein
VITWADIQARRATRDTARAAASVAAVQLAWAREVLLRLQRQSHPDPVQVAEAEARVEAADQDAAAATAAVAAAQATYDAEIAALPGQLDPAVPCLLLPVRLETRFGTTPAGALLRVRIYPDEIHLDAHERGLTDGEIRVGTAYWRALWDIATEAAPGPGAQDNRPVRRVAAWEEVTRRLGPARGALVTAALTPTNQPPGPPAFPAVPTAAAPWTRPSWAAAMPERWTVRAWRDGAMITEAHGELIPRQLPAGPGPQGIDASADWLTDFGRAVTAGMAVTLDVGEPRVDMLTVVGVRGTDTPAEGAAALVDLLQAHHFTDGLDLLPLGTPTNNAPERRTGVDAHAVSAETSYDVERAGLDLPGARVRRPVAGTDADRLSAALGLAAVAAGADPADVLPAAGGPQPDPFGTVASRSDRGVADAQDMATVLWPATFGYYGTQMLGDQGPLTRSRRWILDTVSGGGPLPTLRVGAQPYGVLPTTPLDAWRPWPDTPDLAVLTTAATDADLNIGLDLDPAHQISGGWLTVAAPPGLSAGWAMTAGRVSGAERLVGLAVSPGGQAARLTIGDHPAGIGPTWGLPLDTPTTHPVRPSALPTGRCGVAVTLFPGLDTPCAVVVFEHIDPVTGPVSGTVRIGIGLESDRVEQWRDAVELPPAPLAAGVDATLVSACVTALDGDEDPALALLYALTDGTLAVRIGPGLTAQGDVTGGWTSLIPTPVPAGTQLRTASLAADPVRGRPLLMHYTTADGGGLTSQYLVVSRLTDLAVATPQWAGPFPLPGPRPDAIAVAVAVIDWGRDPVPGWDSPTQMVNLLSILRQAWRDVLEADRVPQVYPEPGRSSVQSLLDLLSSDAVSASIRARGAIGPVLAGNLWRLLGQELGPGVGAGYEPRLQAAVQAALSAAGLGVDGRITRLGYETDAEPFPGPLVAADADEQQPLPAAGNYLIWAATALPLELHAGRGGRGGTEGPLLERLVRHATLHAWADAAFDIRPPDGVTLPLPEPELVDAADLTASDPVTPVETLTSWRHLSRATFGPGHPRFPGRSVLEVLAALVATAETTGGTVHPAVVDLVAHRAALRRLATLPTGTLELLAMGNLDVATHRLDAWVTAVATTRLRALRAARPDGLHLGGFGIALDLSARTAPLSEGYLVAPSLAHAATAAIARSAYLAHFDDPDGGRLALELTSRRVRHGLDLLDGLRAGQSMSALLGQAFERRLHDLPGNLDRYLGSLRALAPATAGKRTTVPAGAGPGAAEARGPLDGLALLRRHTAGTIPWGTTPEGESVALPATDLADPDHAAIAGLLAALADQMDAVGDLALAEAVYQTVQGNPVRAGALLDAVNRGEPVHADPDVVRTPRSGIAVTHRLLVILPAGAPAPSWSTLPAPAARAAAEPAVEAWAGSLLGPSAKTRWRALFPAADGNPTDSVVGEYTLVGLGLCALDIVAAATAADVTLAGGLPGSPTVDSLLLTYAAAWPPAGAVPGAAPALLLERSAAWPADDLSVPELLEIGRRLGLLLGAARPARPADLAEPGRDPGAPADPTLAARATAAAAGLAEALEALRDEFAVDAQTRAALATAVPGVDTATLTCALDLPGSVDPGNLAALAGMPDDVSAVRAALRTLALYGVPGAAAETPVGAGDEVRVALLRQAHRIARVTVGQTAAAAAATDPDNTLHAVLGEEVVALPRFAAADPTGLRAALTARDAAGDAVPSAVTDWLADAADVRAGVARLRDLRLVSAACARDGQAQVRVAQLPPPATGATDRWAALPLPNNDPAATRPAGLVGLVLTGPALDPPTVAANGSATDVLAGPLAGLLVDEWIEVVPARTTTGAVTFHLDSPGASPPQSLLLAVSPDPTQAWSLDLLEGTVLDTLRLAQERMVDPDLVPALGHVLPALMLARNDGDGGLGDTIATAFAPA